MFLSKPGRVATRPGSLRILCFDTRCSRTGTVTVMGEASLGMGAVFTNGIPENGYATADECKSRNFRISYFAQHNFAGGLSYWCAQRL
jgi:hypothetical protein